MKDGQPQPSTAPVCLVASLKAGATVIHQRLSLGVVTPRLFLATVVEEIHGSRAQHWLISWI